MITIGVIDHYLNNWHSDHYPEYLRLAARFYGFDARLTAAWAESDHPNGGLTTEQWCNGQGVRRASTCEELIDSVDAIMVMCADNCLPHEKLAQMALASGKPVYCDKTFAPDLQAARRMFDRAEKHNTPLFTCSAQRYCMELVEYVNAEETPARSCHTTGPGDMINYSVHQFEMIQAVMGCGAERCKAFSTEGTRNIIYDYGSGRLAVFMQGPQFPFSLHVMGGDRKGRSMQVADYYMNFMHMLLRFFIDGKSPVTREDTLEIMAMQQAGREALLCPDAWVEIGNEL